MAEFSELVRIKKRICIKYKSSGCIGCPLEHSRGDLCGIISISGYSDNKFLELEEALLSWAAEHPEPVYPTFREWLISIGVIGKMSTHSVIADKLAMTPISADIADKLGIEPKEG